MAMNATTALTPLRMLELWERGADASPIERALLLAAEADAAGDPAQLSIGARDARLLRVRQATFGDRIDARATCYSCGEELEFTLSAEVLLAIGHADQLSHSVDVGGTPVRFRLPTSADLLAGADSVQTLLERCLEGEVEADGAVRAAVALGIAGVDPLADVTLALACPACGETADVPFDIGALFWTELDAWARRTMADVAVLARAFGWTEGDVLALGPRRRATYLELAGTR